MLREMYSDTLELDISFDIPVRRPALFSRETFLRTGTSNGRERVNYSTLCEC